MRPSRRLLATPLVLTTALMLAACGDESPNARSSDRVDTTDPTNPTNPTNPTDPTNPTVPDTTTSPPRAEPLTIDSLDDDDLVFRLGLSGSNGGDDPYLVSVYAGGDVYLSSDSQPLGFTTFRVGDAALDELLGLATAARPFDKVVDYGEPQITDVGSTVVTVNADQGATTVSAWALGVDDDALDLDPAQTEARRHLGAVAGALAGLADSEHRIGDVTPYEPANVNVLLSAPNDDAGEDGLDTPWPLSQPLHRQRLYQVYDALCFQVSGADIALVMATDDETFWGLPTATPVAAPGAVRVTAAAALPDTLPCDGAERTEPVRALTDAQEDETAYDWTNPWPVDLRTTTTSLERWMVDEALITRVLSRREDWSANDWTRWNWFDVRYVGVGVGVDGRRFLDVLAECNPFVTDEEPACTIRARFDVATERLVEFEAS
ncbi:MAG: hypothetical protein WKF58_16980 [Ilumatobacteraceae bacterium]